MVDYSVWEAIRAALAFAACGMLPGYLISGIATRSWALAQFERVPLSFCFGLGANVLLGYIAHWAFGSLRAFTYLMWAAVFVLVIANVFCFIRSDRQGMGLGLKAPGWGPLGLVLLSAVVFSLNLRNGVRVIYGSDTWFHIAHIREIVESGRIVPQNAFWPTAPLSETTGMWHLVLATTSYVSGVDVLPMWPIVNALMSLITLASIYVFADTLVDDGAIALLSAALFGILGRGVVGTAVWPSGASYALMWTALSYFLRYLRQGELRTFLLALVSAVMPVFSHPQETILLCAAAACFMVVRALVPVARKTALRRAVGFLLAIVLLALPLMVLEYPARVSSVVTLQGPSVGVPVRQEASLLLRILENLYPQLRSKTQSFFNVFLPLGLVAVIFSWRLLRHFGEEWAELLFSLTWGPLLLFFMPGLSHATVAALTKTYSWRVALLTPAPVVLAMVLTSGLRELSRVREREGHISWNPGTLLSGGALLAVLLVLSAERTPSLVRKGNDSAPAPVDTPEVYLALNDLPASSVILSDPSTSYVIPGLTSHFVVLNEADHGALPDLERRLDAARELLSGPYQSVAEAIATLERYAVDYILINLAWMEEPFRLLIPFYSDYTLELLDENGVCFTRTYDDADFRLYRYNRGRCAADRLFRKGGRREVGLDREELDHILDTTLVEGLHLVGFSTPQDLRVPPGESLDVELLWEAMEPLDEPYALSVEVLCDYPQADKPYGKIIRKMYERRTGQALKANEFHWLPLPPGNLDSGETLSDKAIVSIPIDMPAGQCDLLLYVLGDEEQFSNRPLLPGLLLENHYLYPGVRLGKVTIETSAD